MKVNDLIERLKLLPSEMQVMMDGTLPGSEMFKFSDAVTVDVVGIGQGEEIVLISADKFTEDEEGIS